MRTAIALFNRDLRVHDNPALEAASRAGSVVPLFVLDGRLLAGDAAAPNRIRFLLESLSDLDRSLRAAGSRLFVRAGDPVVEALTVAQRTGATEIHVSADWSRFARRREERLKRACARARIAFHRHPGVTVVPPGEVVPGGLSAAGEPGEGPVPHYRVFSPYHRAWRQREWRAPLPPPARLRSPSELEAPPLPRPGDLVSGAVSSRLEPGGERAGRARMETILGSLDEYERTRDDLAGASTSRLSAHLRFGCVSPLELATEALARPGGEAFARQLCWRDFHHQVLAAFPAYAIRNYRSRGDAWSRSQRALAAWKQGLTGFPIVDAAMRQLLTEGFMHNRARMIVASFLCKDLYIDWREGARHFFSLLADGDIANNAGNWQWVAGTGNDTRPNRILNPLRQAARFDPWGDYVRRHLPELEAIGGAAVHEPWKLPASRRRSIDYPGPILDHAEAAAAFRAARTARRGP